MDKIKINYKSKEILTPNITKEVSFMVEETDLNLQQDVIATKRELKSKERELEEVKSTYPLDVQKYLSLRNEIESIKKGLLDVKELQEELGFSVTAVIS